MSADEEWSRVIQLSLTTLLNKQIQVGGGMSIYHLTGQNGETGLVVVAFGEAAEALEQGVEKATEGAEVEKATEGAEVETISFVN